MNLKTKLPCFHHSTEEYNRPPKYIQPRISTYHDYDVSAIIDWFLKSETAFLKAFCFVLLTRN